MNHQESRPSPEGEKPIRRIWRSKDERDLDQAFADWFGAGKAESETTGIHPLETIISEVLSRLPLDSPSVDPEMLRKGWKAAAGDFIGAHAELVSIARGTAIIHVLQPAMRYHLEQWKAALLEKLRAEFGEAKVREIRFRIG